MTIREFCSFLVLVVWLAGCQQPAATGSQPPAPGAPAPGGVAQPARPKAGPYRVLFDASHGETAGNADWIISTSMPDPLAENSDPRRETDWTGAISAWGVALQQTGRYKLATLPRGGRITYGTAAQIDLANFDALVVPEPNVRFTAAEKTAIVTFVQNGGGLFMIADHDGSDRNNDGIDSLRIWNDLMSDNGVAQNPFGFRFDVKDIQSDDPRSIPAGAAGDPVIRGPFGVVKGSIIRGGTTATLDTRANPSARGLLYRSGATTGGATGAFFLTSSFGKGRVAAWGDSSPVDDGTGATNEQLFDGWDDAGGSNAILALNATEWLAQGGAEGGSAMPATPAPGEATQVAAQPSDGQIVRNGGFERGLEGWQARGAQISDARAHGGAQSARLCGVNNCTATLTQRISIPASTRSARLSYAVSIATEETRHAFDFMTVELRGRDGKTLATIERLSDGEASYGWQEVTFDLSPYAGQTVDLVFDATSGKVAPTTFFVDDVAVVDQ